MLLLIILACSACSIAVQAENYTAIVSYGQTPYQLGYLSKGNVTGWTWWDTDGGMQQKNIILLSIMMENATPVSGLSPPTWIQDSSTTSSGNYSWKAGRDIQSWHYLVELQKYEEDKGFLIKIIDWLINLFTGVSPPPEGFNLTFKTRYNMTESYGFVKVSVDRGDWVTLANYSGNSTGWEEKAVNLTDYSGKKILLAFHFISNNNNDVWWIDDIKVNSVPPFSDGAENTSLPPRLKVNVSYPGYDYSGNNFSVKNTTVELVEDYVHQVYYGVFFYPGDAYTGKYTVNFSTRINSTNPNVLANNSFNTTLWGCQRRGCHDSSSPQSDPSIRNATVMIHPDNITSGMKGNCLTMCHSSYSSQFLRATPVHLHDIKYGHQGGFVYGESGWAAIYNSINAYIQMYYNTSVTRPISQTPFNVVSHVEIANCTDCHTNFIHDQSGSDTYYIAASNSLKGTNLTQAGVHKDVSCEACHGNLNYPSFNGTTKLNDTIGDYDPEFMSYEAMTKTYIINMDDSEQINVTVSGDDPSYRIYLSLVGPIDSAGGLQDLSSEDNWAGTYTVPSVNGTAVFATGLMIGYPVGNELRKVTFDSLPRNGTWIARVFTLSQERFNYTITSSHPIQRKPVTHIPWNCSECHNPNASGSLARARTDEPIPSWDNVGLSYTHTDINKDGRDDVTCRLCHNSFHDISIRNCTDCHKQRPGGHTMGNYYEMGYAGCVVCHRDPHFEPEAAGGGNCADCHLEGGANATVEGLIISRDGFFNSSHTNITGDFNAANYSAISMVCWGCHVNYTEQLNDPRHIKYVNDVPQFPVCEDCHFNGTPLNGDHLRKQPPVQIPEHQPLGEDIQTNISTNCTFCHNNSLSIPIPTANVTRAEAKNYVSHYLTTIYLMTPTDHTTECLWCHVDNSDNVSWGKPINPFNSTRYNHTLLNLTPGKSSACYPCHISNRIMVNGSLPAGFTFHNESMSPGAGKNCTSCHDIGGMVRPEYQIDIHAMNRSGAIHYDLNRGAADTLDPNNVRCWACHGDGNGSEAAQPVGHPDNYTTPKNCINQACHNFNRSIFNEPMVYEHIRYVDKVDKHVNTSVDCTKCHKNSIMDNRAPIISNDTPLVSHYGSTQGLIETSDCIYCHLDEDNAEKWGSAPDPRNHTDYASVNKTLVSGKPWKLVDNYTLTLIETARPGGAIFTLEKDGVLLRRELVSDNDVFKYEVRGLGRENTSIVNLRIKKLFSAKDQYLVELSGSVLASRIHRETDNKSCYACHDNEYRTNMPDGMDYYVLKKDSENVTLARMPVNFTEHDKKMLNMGESWEIGQGYRLHVADVNLKRGNAWLKLYRNETLIEDIIINEGSNFTHEEWVLERKINVFSAKLDRVFIGKTPAIVLTDVRLIAGEQKILNSTTKIMQTGTSLKDLPLDKSITVGKEPENFHVYTLIPGGYSPDCISCHTGNGVAPIKINIDAFRNGVHVGLNRNATYTSFITDDANKACWACHGNGSSSEPVVHPTPYLGNITPQTSCIGCHGYSQFGAKQIYQHHQGAEISTNATCWDCHFNTLANNTLANNIKNVLAAVSHYSTRKELLNTSRCDVCHNNETNAPMWGKAPQVIKHNASSNCPLCHAGKGVTTFHDKGITITRICEDCHVNKAKAEELKLPVFRTHYPDAPEDKANTLENNSYTCKVCHNATNKTLHTNLQVREYRNETMGYCFQCHSTQGKFPYKPKIQIGVLHHGTGIKVITGCEACHSLEGVSKFHTPSLVGKGYFSGAVSYEADCTACHEKHEERKYQPYEGIRCTDCHAEYGTAHYTGAQAKMANKTWTCVLCHNEEAERFHNLTHLAANVTEAAYEPCLDCHTDTESLKMAYNRSLTIIGGTMSGISQPISNESIITCTSCHNATGESRFHSDSYPGGTVQNPGWQNWTAGNITDCKDCHTYHGGAPPFNATNMGTEGRSPAGTAHGFAPNCTLCHGGADPISFHSLASTEFIPRLAVTLDPENVPQGESSLLQATVVLPPLMKVTRAEYFMDEIGKDGYGQPLEFVLGRVNESSALVGAVINTTELSFEKHLIFVHAKDSAGKWSKMEIAVLTVTKPAGFAAAEILLKEIVPAVIFIGLLYFIWRRFK